MNSVILTNWTVHYAADAAAGAGMKQIKWTGTTGTNTVNELYSALMHLFDNSFQMDAADSIPFKAVTPTLYEIGSFDAGDRRPWFIDPDSVKHLTGGGLNSKGWTRDTSARTASHGIYKLTRSTTNILTSDIGDTITASGGATGWLLHVSGNNLWVRSTGSTSGDDFPGSGSLEADTSSNSDTITASVSAESIWSNIYTLGTIEANTEMVVYQNSAALTQWWSTGHIDILVLTTDFGTLTDLGVLTIYARQYSKLYDHYQATVATGGRTPIPIATAADTNNPTGFRTFTGSSGNGTFVATHAIYVGASWSAATAKGILTAVGGTEGAPILTYYLIGNLTDMSSTVYDYNFSSDTRSIYCTAGAPAAAGPNTSPSSTLTVVFGATSQDLSNGSGSRPYSVILDLLDTITVAQLYQRVKYLTRYGQITDIDTGSQSVIGQEYLAIGDYRIPYDGQSTNFVEGETVNGQTSGATGVVTSDHDSGTSGYLVLRTVRGTFADNENLRSGATVRAVANIPSGAEVIAPTKTSPFGTYAGGKFFGARGVWLDNVPSADATDFVLTDTLGVQQTPPNTVPIEVSGVVQNTQCYIADSTPTEYLNTAATTLVAGDEYKASTTYTYTVDIAVTIRAREKGYLTYEASGSITSTGLSVTAVWLVDPNWQLVVSGVNITFDNASGDITRASGNFTTDGWLVVMGQVTVSGSTLNDGIYTITAVGTTTVTVSETLTDEGPIAGVTLTYTRRSL